MLVSDYGHHPTEISLTIKSIKNSNMDKILLTIFQPHQYSRTYELLEDFKNCFSKTDKLIIPNIYESRDTKEDKEKINTEKLVELINHNDKIN
ncbi:MAG: cyanophycin synthetase [bacterium]|nr:cyanophycin synthetase [bacterium]